MTNNKKEKWVGQFWLKTQKKGSWRGELKYHPIEGIILELEDAKAKTFHVEETTSGYFVIRGLLDGWNPVTLIDCFVSGENWTGQHSILRIFVNFALLGVVVPNLAVSSFKGFSLQSQALTQWINPRNLKVDMKRRSKKISMVYSYKREPKKLISGNRAFKYWDGFSCPGGLGNDGIFTFKAIPGISLDYKNMKSWAELLSDVFWLEQLFNFASGQYSGPPKVSLKISKTLIPHERDRKTTKEVKLLISQPWYKEAKPNHFFHRLFIRDDIKPMEDRILSHWMDLHEQLAQPLSLYRFTKTEDRGVELRFTLLVQAVEALHRRFIDGPILDEKEFEKIQQMLESSLPKEMKKEAREAFLNKIKYMNEPSLNKRVRDIFKKLKDASVDKFPEYKFDSKMIADYRNSFTHVKKRGDDNWIPKVCYCSDLLEMLFEFFVLILLGLSSEKTKSLFERNFKYTSLSKSRAKLLGSK